MDSNAVSSGIGWVSLVHLLCLTALLYTYLSRYEELGRGIENTESLAMKEGDPIVFKDAECSSGSWYWREMRLANVVVFGAGCMHVDNEMELGTWKTTVPPR